MPDAGVIVRVTSKVPRSATVHELQKLPCNLCKINPSEYLKSLRQHSSELFRNPDKWLPRNYEQSIGHAADWHPGDLQTKF